MYSILISERCAMCGRYAVDPRKLERLVRLLSLPQPDFLPHFDIHPSQTAPVIRNAGNGPEWALMRWGLIPHWAKEAKTAYSTFNARVETAQAISPSEIQFFN
ncbi:SOS response-associated peptidase family protein [Acidithiobacillus ferrooxidans]|nr:SOS response-associated peptidase family protein [Acidithiobacillus ferrooxidans]